MYIYPNFTRRGREGKIAKNSEKNRIGGKIEKKNGEKKRFFSVHPVRHKSLLLDDEQHSDPLYCHYLLAKSKGEKVSPIKGEQTSDRHLIHFLR